MAFFTLLDWGNRAFWISVSPTTQTSGFSILVIISQFMGDHACETSIHVAVTLHGTFILRHKLLQLVNLWIKSYCVTVQMKPVLQYFHMVPQNEFTLYFFS